MASSILNANSYVINKYCWMARQLRNLNDCNSIMQWSNAMSTVRNLLLQQDETYNRIPLINPKQTSSRKYSIEYPTTLSFPPTVEPSHVLTPSLTPMMNFTPQPPSPLSVHYPRWLSILPSGSPDNDLNMPPIKKRKTALPPQVDCDVQTHL